MSKELEFQFDSKQDFQLDAINSIVKVFEGQPLNSHHTTSFISTNSSNLDLVSEEGIVRNVLNRNIPILENIQKVQTENKLEVSEYLEICEAEVDREGNKNSEIINCPYNFTVEMETGTGKTYTYIRTCYELNKVYGFKKFVIVVPSVAIREGVIQALNDTHKHFQLLYSNVPINFTLFDSSNKTQLQQFSRSPSIEILVINIDSFTKESNIINKRNEYGNIPIT
ncbi:MAG: DEAD/DEAH box helicase family protein, partial [Bacteroidales bacterium]|nr:DEAD/DEAH box helicase family protein [Bacteroidales bacterium]